MARSIRFWLGLGLSTLIGIAIAVFAATLLGVLLPRLNAEVEVKNRQLGLSVGSQVAAFLGTSSAEVRRLGEEIAAAPDMPAARVRILLDTLAHAVPQFEAIFLVDSNDQVTDVGLPMDRRSGREELSGVDFSGRAFVRTARGGSVPVWSDTYLSSRGRFVVAVALPVMRQTAQGKREPWALVAELNLAELSLRAAELGQGAGVLPIVIDRRGNFVAHPDPRRGLSEENIGHLMPVKSGLSGEFKTSRFILDGIDYVGTTTPISGPGWLALIAQPVDEAFATVRSTLISLILGGCFALALALGSAAFYGRRLTARVAEFSRHVQAVADGNYTAPLPHSRSEELDNLAVSMRKMANAVLEREEAQRLAASVFSSSAEGICISDANRRIVSVNPALTVITGYTAEDLIGQTPRVFSSGRHDTSFYRDMWQSINTQGVWRGEIWNRRKNGDVYPEWLTISSVKNKHGIVTHYIGSFFDITERKHFEEHIIFLANHDGLTGLPNRMLLDDRLSQAIAHSRRNEQQIGVLFLDLDRFKLINDTLGHDVGDRLLEQVAGRLRGVLRESETVARLGGDEFVIILPEASDIDSVAVVARKVLEAIAAPHLIGSRTLHVTPSIGISIYPQDGTDAALLLRNADTAMYHAKEHGRNNFQFFTQAMNQAVQERVGIENDLRLALERNEFILYYQPQVDCRSGDIIGMEALIRWRHPERGLVPPDRFISIAEETGLIIPIGAWVLREACQQARRWHDAGQTLLRMSVNLSARQFEQADLYDEISGALSASGIDPAMLELELTESMLMADPTAAIDLMHTLAGLGIKLAIDDFGTGYSSLAYLKRFPVTRLKIDRSFVRDLSSDSNDAAIVRAIVSMAANMKLEVIAEGVETLEQLKYLAHHGCHDIQGYYFSRPLPAQEFTQFTLPVPTAI